VLLAIYFLVFLLFEFRPTEIAESPYFAKVKVFSKTLKISYETMETITKAAASTLQNTINLLRPSLRSKSEPPAYRRWLFLSP
jgi:hypothetical protein